MLAVSSVFRKGSQCTAVISLSSKETALLLSSAKFQNPHCPSPHAGGGLTTPNTPQERTQHLRCWVDWACWQSLGCICVCAARSTTTYCQQAKPFSWYGSCVPHSHRHCSCQLLLPKEFSSPDLQCQHKTKLDLWKCHPCVKKLNFPPPAGAESTSRRSRAGRCI